MQMDHFTWMGKTQTALHKEKMEKKKIPQGQSPKFFTDLLPGSEEFQRRLGLQCVGGHAWEGVLVQMKLVEQGQGWQKDSPSAFFFF